MSGGGGTGGAGGGFGQDSGIDCAGLVFDTFLSSVDPEALNDLEVGAALDIELRAEPRALLAVKEDGNPVGAITKRVRELLRCIQQQVRYRAVIKHIDGGDVEVRVEPV
jgi:hypothetical protein